TGLPVIAANDTLTIVGNGDTIQRSTAKGTPAFRLFDVANGASLTLGSLTVQNGLAAQGGPVGNEGGAMLNQGSLTLNSVTVQNNATQGPSAAGGGIYSGGSLTVQSNTIRNNQALGSAGSAGGRGAGGTGGSAFGGGLYISGGTATLTGVT